MYFYGVFLKSFVFLGEPKFFPMNERVTELVVLWIIV